MMASTGFFRHPNGEKRIISVIIEDDKKDLVVVATTASDISNAAKFLTRDFETRVVEGSEDAELFLNGKIRFVVICYEDFDMRLADAFAKANIPIRIVSMDMIIGASKNFVMPRGRHCTAASSLAQRFQ